MKKLNPDRDNRLGIIAIVGAFGVVIAVTLRDATFLAATIDGFSELTVALIQLAGVAFFLWFIVVVGQLVFQIVNNTFAYRKDLKNQKEERRRCRSRVRKRQQQQNLEAQLNKPDFGSRLQNFTGEPVAEKPYVPQAEFWQLESDHQPSRPRSISLIRSLLMRISKYVNKSKMK